MTKTPRGLSPDEQAAWARLAKSVTPLHPQPCGEEPPVTARRPAETLRSPANPLGKPGSKSAFGQTTFKATQPTPKATQSHLKPVQATYQPPSQKPRGGSLDSHWERRFKSGQIAPDLTLDLHDHSLDRAYDRLMSGLDQARMMGARVVLVIAGRERPVDPADRQEKRGAIRAKLLDWIAASRHADTISGVRRAHNRHGGGGALYLVLRRQR